MTAVESPTLAAFLAGCPPFDSLDAGARKRIADEARVQHFDRGALILDAFSDRTVELFVVITGRVDLWSDSDHIGKSADESLDVGEVFGFSAMLTERSIGPRAVAVTDVTVARIPAAAVAPAFASRRGAQFLAERLSSVGARPVGTPTYSTVDELIVHPPLLVQPSTPVREVARRMTDSGAPYAAVRLDEHRFGLVTDSVLRRRILVEGLSPSTPVGEVMEPALTVTRDDSASEALIMMLDHDAEFLLVTDRAGELGGAIAPRDFAVSSTTADVSLHEQLRRAATIEELQTRARRVPAMLGDLLSRDLVSGRVIATYSATLDTIVRRAITLIFETHPELSGDAFTWMSLGSNGRREAVLSSDVDSAVAFDNGVPLELVDRYRDAFAEVNQVLAQAGLSSDDHGATAQRPVFSRTQAEWREAGQRWLSDPAEKNGAMMASLLVDGRPIHGDPGLPAVIRVFSDLRRHPGTMRLLLQESLSYRAKLRSMRDVLTRRSDTFDIKVHALVPIVNIARWAALSVGSAVLPTAERLRLAAGSAMLPDGAARTLIEVFDVLQRLRLRYQLLQVQSGEKPSDVLVMDQVSPIDRSVIAQAVREISAIQRRMDNVALYVPTEAWASPDPS